VRAFEEVPYTNRIGAESTCDAIRLGAAYDPDALAIQYLTNADPADQPIVISHRDFLARVTQAANMFHTLGVSSDDVVSFMLPLLPEALITLFGAEAAGIANPVNPLLEPYQVAEILEAAHTRVLVALGRVAGNDIWQKVEQVRGPLNTSRQLSRSMVSAIRGKKFIRSAISFRGSRPIGLSAVGTFPVIRLLLTSTPAAPLAHRSLSATPMQIRSIRPGP
jgi:hypothetical protein